MYGQSHQTVQNACLKQIFHECKAYNMARQSPASEHVFLYFYYYMLPFMINMIDLFKTI